YHRTGEKDARGHGQAEPAGADRSGSQGRQHFSQIWRPPQRGAEGRHQENHGRNPGGAGKDARLCGGKRRPAGRRLPRLSARNPSSAGSPDQGREKIMLNEEVLFLPVTELARRIRSKQLSPVELTESYLARSRELGPKLNAYATLTPELALKQAKAAEKEIAAGKYRGPLHGIPYAAKDLLAVKGYPTTWGARPYLDQRFDYDATVVHKLETAGAVLLGKAAMIELAGGMGYRYASASATGPAKNPWNTEYWTCGSSSGSAAVTGAGLGAFTIGTETWGSIICPSGFCGLSGLRPTYGRVSR